MIRIRSIAALLVLAWAAVAGAADDKKAKSESGSGSDGTVPLPEMFRGMWELDADRLPEMPFIKAMPKEKQGPLVEEIKKALVGARWEFGPRTMIMHLGGKAFPGLTLEVQQVEEQTAYGRIKRVDNRWEDVRFVLAGKALTFHTGQMQVSLKRIAK